MGDPKPTGPIKRIETERTRTSFGTPQRLPDHARREIPDAIGGYRILGRLGEGGMAMVFEAEQQEPRRKVALKLVRGDIFLEESQVRMFHRECEALARLKHPSIAAIYETGRTPGGRPWFAMELVRGRTLHDYLQDRPQPDTRGELRHRLEMFREICEAVSYAHQRGVIHRDLKPSNIIVTNTRQDDSTPTGKLPEIKILDFGLARMTDTDLQASVMTEVGVIKGTLPYMSPEQIRGDPREIDLRSDVYSLGVLLYEMLAGCRPYDTRDKSMLEAARVICEEEPEPLRQNWSGIQRLDSDIETITAKALSKDADERYASAAALSEDVARYLAAQPILARPPSAVYQLKKFAQRHRGIVWAAVALLLAVVAGSVAATTFAVRQAQRATQLQRFAYQTLIRSATEAVEKGDRVLAREMLMSEQVPETLRGWEWNLLFARSEPSGVTIEAPVPSDSPAWVGLEQSELVYVLDDTGYRFDAWTGERLDAWALGLAGFAGFPAAPLWIQHGPDRYSLAAVDVDGGRRVHFFTPAGRPCGVLEDVPFASFGPQGSHLARFGEPGSNRVVIWDLANCRERLSLEWDWWLSRSLSRDGSMVSLYKGGHAVNWGMTQVHEVPSGRLLARFPVPSEPTTEAFTPDGSTLISATEEGELRILGIDPPMEMPSIPAHDGRVLALAVSSDGRWVASAADDQTVRLWDLSTRKRLAEYQVAGRTASLRFSPEDRFLLRVADDNDVTILDTAERTDPGTLIGHGSYVYAAAVQPGGELIATGDWAGVILLWDARSGRQVAKLADVDGGIHAIRFSPDGSRLIAIGDAVSVWELRTGSLVASLDRIGPGEGRETQLPAAGTPLDPDARRVVSGWRPDDATVEIWNVETGALTRRPLRGLPLEGEPWVTADGKFVVEAWVRPGKPVLLEIRDLDGGLHMRLPTTGGHWWPFALTHGSRRPLLAAPVQGESSEFVEAGSTVGLWEVGSKRKIGELRGHKREVMSVVFTPDDRRVVTGSRDGTIRLWDTETFVEIARFKGHRLYIKDLALSPDGMRLISASGDGTARIWDLTTTNERLRLRRLQERDLDRARPLVADLFETLPDAESVVDRLRTDPDLSPGVRREALREALHRSIRQRSAVDGVDDDARFFFLPKT